MKPKNKNLVRVEKGYGPRHAFNAAEGNEAVPEELPSPPAEELKFKPNSISNLRPAMLAKALGQELGGLSKEDVAKMAVGMLAGGEGEMPLGEAPILTRANRNGTTIRASFDATKPAPDPKALEQQFADAGHNVSVTKFAPDLVSATKGEHNFRIDVWDNNNRLSSDAAAKAMEGMFGADAPYRAQTQFEQSVPLEQRYGAAHEYGSRKLTDAQLREQEPEGDRKGKARVGVQKGFGPRHSENAKEGDLTQVNTDTVPAMLTPREAVLNRNAAELAGRGNIEQLNEEGNNLAKKGVDLAAKGQASVPVVKPPKAVTDNLLKYVLPGAVRREATAAIPKGLAQGDDDVPLNAWGEGSSLGDRALRVAKDPVLRKVIDPYGVGKGAYQDLMHFLVQFGAPTEKAPDALGAPISNEEMMRRYPGLQLQAGDDDIEVAGNSLTPGDLRQFPGWLRDILRTTPEYPKAEKKGEHQFDPRAVPIVPGDPAGNLMYDPNLSATENQMALVAKGTSDMKSKQSKSKPKGYAGGSPYAQGYQKLQGGGDVPFKPAGAVQSGDINPNVLAGQNLKQGQLNYWNRYGQLPPGAGGPPPPVGAEGSTDPYGQPEAPFTGGTPPLQPYGASGSTDPYGSGGTGNYSAGLGNYGGGGTGAYGGDLSSYNDRLLRYGAGAYGGGFGQEGGGSGAYGGGGGNYGGGGAYGNLNQAGKKPYSPYGGGGFYPPGMGFASGTQDVPGGIGAPNPTSAYSKDPVDFKAPDLSGFLKAIQEEAQKRGISQSQMADIAKQFSGMGGNAGAPGTGTLITDSGMAYPTTGGGYQGGISDIGYPPFLMPNAEYHADKGSTWVGPYDPEYLVQRYAGGTSAVPGYQEGVNRVLHLPGSISPWDLSDADPFGNFSGGRNVRALQEGPNYQGMYGGNMLGGPSVQPPGWSLSGPTRSPTNWSYQGPIYGWTAQALPADPDQPLAGVNSRQAPPKRAS